MKSRYILLISLFFIFIISVPVSASYSFHHLWGTEDGNYIITVGAGTDEDGNIINYPVVARPVGMLSDGSSLDEMNDLGLRESSGQWLEAIYLSTGDVGKGVVDINPLDGSQSLPALENPADGHYSRISDAIPSRMGPVNSSVVIYELSPDDSGALGHAGNIYVTTTTGNIIAIRAVVHFDTTGSNTRLFPIDYSLLWAYHINGSISNSAGIFYGDPFDNSDDRIVVASDDGQVFAFSPNSGTPIWSTEVEGDGFYSPEPVDSANMALILSESGNVYALNISDGSLIWHYEMDENILSFSISHSVKENCGPSSMFFIGSDGGEIQEINVLDGDAGPKISLKHSAPVSALFCTAASDYMIFGGTEEYREGVGYVFSIGQEGDSLKINWDREIYGGVKDNPAYYDNRYVYFSSSAGLLYGFEVISGKAVFVLHSVSSPLNTVIVASQVPGMSAPAAIIGSHEDGSLFSISTDATYNEDGSQSDDFPDETDETSNTDDTVFPGFIPMIATVAVSVMLFRIFRRK